MYLLLNRVQVYPNNNAQQQPTESLNKISMTHANTAVQTTT